MEDKKKHVPFCAPRWNDDMGGIVTGHVETTEEERDKSKKEFRDFLKKQGVLKDDE